MRTRLALLASTALLAGCTTAGAADSQIQAVEGMTVNVACSPGSLVVARSGQTAKLTCRPPTATPTPTASGSSTPTPTPTTPTPTPTASGSERIIERAYVTGYSWYDNTPPGSAAISHPIIHQQAGGAGTYADPITIAVGHDRSSGRSVLDYPAGTRMYLPAVRRYFIVEDTCGDGGSPQNGPCHNLGQAPTGATTWVDIWIGGAGGSQAAVNACMNKITGLRQLVVNPTAGHPVVAGPVFQNGACTALYS